MRTPLMLSTALLAAVSLTWAAEQSIPPAWVQTRRVTLNHDNGLLARFDPNARPPYVVRQRGGAQRALPLKELARRIFLLNKGEFSRSID